jgi:hypothetical protein
MIEKPIPKDISKYQAKLMLGLTTRQACLYIPGVIAAVVVFFALKSTIGDLALFLGILTACPFILFAAFKPLGLPLEKFLTTAMLSMLLAPVNRRYKTENTYYKTLKQINNDAAGTPPKTKQSMKNKKYVSSNPQRQPL